MYHSRAAALLTGDYADRTIEAIFSASVAPVGAGVVWTYTVGANVIARLEQSTCFVEPSAAINQVSAIVRINRGSGLISVNELYAPVGGSFVERSLAHDIILLPGDIIEGVRGNGDAVNRIIKVGIHVREIDL